MTDEKRKPVKLNIYSLFDTVIIPLCSPAPAAWTVFYELSQVIQGDAPGPAIVSAAGAVSIELIGFRSMSLLTRFISFNRANKKTEEAEFTAPVWQVGLMVACYLIVTISIIVFLKKVDGLADYVVAIFPLFGIVGGWFVALQGDQTKREIARDEARQKSKQARKQARKSKQAGQEQASKSKSKRSSKQGKSKQGTPDSSLLAEWQKSPEATDQEIGDIFGISRQAINGRRLKMIVDGLIEMTPDGVKVL